MTAPTPDTAAERAEQAIGGWQGDLDDLRERVATALRAAEAGARRAGFAAFVERLRCFITKNLCGTDTWAADQPCRCFNCQLYLQIKDTDLRFLSVSSPAAASPPMEGESAKAAPDGLETSVAATPSPQHPSTKTDGKRETNKPVDTPPTNPT